LELLTSLEASDMPCDEPGRLKSGDFDLALPSASSVARFSHSACSSSPRAAGFGSAGRLAGKFTDVVLAERERWKRP
jgi:hypothetical protein